MKFLSKFSLLFLLVVFAYSSFADANRKTLLGEVHVGLNITTGNSDTENIKSKIVLDHLDLPWDNDIKFESDFKRTNGERSREKYAFDGESRYFVGKHLFLFDQLRISIDRFSPYDFVISNSFGPGHRFINHSNMTFDIQGGPGVRIEKPSRTDDYPTSLGAFITAVYRWTIYENIQFIEWLSIEIGHPNTYTKSTTTLKVKLSKRWGFHAETILEYNTFVPSDSDKPNKLDTETAFGLSYYF